MIVTSDNQKMQLTSHEMEIIARVFGCHTTDITDIQVLKKGMTNHSFVFSCCGGCMIIRIPGEGTDRLINRYQEAAVYQVIHGKGLCDDAVYIDPVSGYKITRFLSDVRECDSQNESDVRRCMEKLRSFHALRLYVGHCFDIFRQINFYENLWDGAPSAYADYHSTKTAVFSLRAYIDAHVEEYCLTHIDAVPDNFLFTKDAAGQEQLQLTDWEYAGMQDPHVDLAMFCIYSGYTQREIDRLIDIYFIEKCTDPIRVKIYAYVAACGLLWSNWCEYKRHLGAEFGEYAQMQYNYAREYSTIVRRLLNHEQG